MRCSARNTRGEQEKGDPQPAILGCHLLGGVAEWTSINSHSFWSWKNKSSKSLRCFFLQTSHTGTLTGQIQDISEKNLKGPSQTEGQVQGRKQRNQKKKDGKRPAVHPQLACFPPVSVCQLSLALRTHAGQTPQPQWPLRGRKRIATTITNHFPRWVLTVDSASVQCLRSITTFNAHNISLRLLSLPMYRWENWGLERLNDLVKVTRLAGDSGRNQIQVGFAFQCQGS